MTERETSKQPNNLRRSLTGQLADFFRYGKRFWIGGIIAFLILLIVLILLTESSRLAPFIYSIF